MAGTVAAALRAALVDALDPLLDPVNVHYGSPGDLGRTETVWMGSARDDATDSSQRVGALGVPVRRSEELHMDLVVEVMSKTTARASEARAVALGLIFEEYLAANPTIGGVTNLLWCIVEGMELDTAETADGPRTMLVYQLRALSDLKET